MGELATGLGPNMAVMALVVVLFALYFGTRLLGWTRG